MFDAIKLFPRERKTKTYYVGGPTADNLGTFMLMEDADDPYIVFIPSFRGFVAAMYSPIEDNWRDQTIFSTKFKDLKSVEMENFEEPDESYVIKRYSDYDIKFIPAITNEEEAFDTVRVLEFLTSFSKIRYESLLNNKVDQAFRDSVTALTPAFIITITENDGLETRLVTFRKGKIPEDPEKWPYDRDRLYGLMNDDTDFVLLQYFVFDKLLRPASHFRPKE